MTNRGCPAHAPSRPTAPCWRRYPKCRLMPKTKKEWFSSTPPQHQLGTGVRGGGTLRVPVQEGHVAAPCCSAIDPESGDRSEVDVASPLLLISHNIHHWSITAHNTTQQRTPPHNIRTHSNMAMASARRDDVQGSASIHRRHQEGRSRECRRH